MPAPKKPGAESRPETHGVPNWQALASAMTPRHRDRLNRYHRLLDRLVSDILLDVSGVRRRRRQRPIRRDPEVLQAAEKLASLVAQLPWTV